MSKSRPSIAENLSESNTKYMTIRTTLAVCLALSATLAGCKQPPSETRTANLPSSHTPVQPGPPASSAAAPIASIPHPRPSGPIQFTDVTAPAGIYFKHNSGAFGKKLLPETMGSGACFIDYDNDGYQDILLVNSMDWPDHKLHKSYLALYHNNHDGTFTDVTREAGLAIELYGMGCAVGDYDNDGYDDL